MARRFGPGLALIAGIAIIARSFSEREAPMSDGDRIDYQGDADRYLLFQGKGGVYILLDDFIHPNSPAIAEVVIEGDKIVYSNRHGERLIERPLKRD